MELDKTVYKSVRWNLQRTCRVSLASHDRITDTADKVFKDFFLRKPLPEVKTLGAAIYDFMELDEIVKLEDALL
jgi:hypothetical protein